MAKNKKNKFKLRYVLILIILVSASFAFYKFFPEKFNKINNNKIYNGYLKSDKYEVELMEKNDTTKTKKFIRGTKIKYFEKKISVDEVLYTEVKINNDHYLISDDYITNKYEEIVGEKTRYVRTSTTIYKEKDKLDISGFYKKGEEINIIGFDRLNDDGSVNMYKTEKGYVYSKYLEELLDVANKNYDPNGLYLTHASRGDSYGGGSADNLDYYPVDKPNFENNKLLDNAKTLYLNCGVLNNIDAYINLAKNTGINAFVVDIKENTLPAYKSDVMKEYSPTAYNKAVYSKEDYKNIIKKLIDNGFYVIGRITTFKDSDYINDHPEDAITSTSTGTPYLHNGSYWPSAFVRRVWEYNVKLAVESVKDIGFNEIQFDYMRFPDRSYTIEKNGLVDMHNIYGETKAQALQSFLFYATDAIHDVNAYVSVDVFGESSNQYVTAYGQYWPAISNVVDVISAMPYPDHFNNNQYGLVTPWTEPYRLMSTWAREASLRQKEIPTPAIARTWIQAYDAIKQPYNKYGPEEIRAEIKGLNDGGLTGGFITWNGSSNINKYQYISTGW